MTDRALTDDDFNNDVDNKGPKAGQKMSLAATLTDEQINDAATKLRQTLAAYMLTPDFEVRAILAADEIQRGGLTDAPSLARALGLPVEFLALALERHAAEYVADHGGLN